MWNTITQFALRLWREDDGFWQVLIPLAVSLLGGLFGGKKAKKSGEQAAGGATLKQLLPIIMELMKQQQGQSAQNYGYQQQRYQANLPLQDALRAMSMGMLPGRYTQGLSLGSPLSRQAPPAPPTPTPPTPPRARPTPWGGE